MISQSPNRLQCPTWCDQSDIWEFDPKTNFITHLHTTETPGYDKPVICIEQLEEVGANFGKLHPVRLRYFEDLPLTPANYKDLIEELTTAAEIGHAINEGRYHGKEVTK